MKIFETSVEYICCETISADEMASGEVVRYKSSGVRRKFSWEGSFNGIWWSFVFSVRCL